MSSTTTTDIEPRGTQFARYARALAACKGDPVGAEAFASANGWHVVAQVCKALMSVVDSAAISGTVTSRIARPPLWQRHYGHDVLRAAA